LWFNDFLICFHFFFAISLFLSPSLSLSLKPRAIEFPILGAKPILGALNLKETLSLQPSYCLQENHRTVPSFPTKLIPNAEFTKHHFKTVHSC
jgi:hypothetical protein